MGIVLDTNVVASALLWNGPPRQLMRFAFDEGISPYTSTALLAELSDVLTRSKFEKKIVASRLSVHQLLELYSGVVATVRPVTVARIAPDPDDDVVIGTALAAHARFIVTGDRALLSVETYEGGRIITVREALQAMTVA